MRIERLDLLRYGRFTDASIPLPSAVPDLHVIFGPNEAGKSTALTAIEDWLFGIPKTTPYNFRHPNNALRIGGVLADGERQLAFCRRKGNKGTLLSEADAPLVGGDEQLATFLSGLDREFMQRMFGLNPTRLTEGGKAMLDATSSAGEALFAAGTGLIGLRQHLQRLQAAADGIWTSRKSTLRTYYAAAQKVADAESKLRETTVTAAKWHDAAEKRAEAEQAFGRLATEQQQLAAENSRLTRIRRVHRGIARLAEIAERLQALASTRVLPEDAATRLTTATRQVADADAALGPLAGQLRLERDKLSKLSMR